MSHSLKSWVWARLRRLDALVARGDLSTRDPPFDATHEPPPPQDSARPGPQPHDPPLPRIEHLGVYAMLIAAIRDELEHFVASHVRLHLAIAERDRFLLTSIGVRSAGAAESRQTLQQFITEFTPEQIKRYLAREVIGALANAAAIDLSQFAGLFDADARDAAEDVGPEGEYRELLEALRNAPVTAATPAYQVSLLGRWHEPDPASPTGSRAAVGTTAATPPVAVVLQAIVPGRRYVIGKGEGCDIRVNGIYTSRRHAEIWLDHGVWSAADAGSTNGIRVESKRGVGERAAQVIAAASIEQQPLKLLQGTRLVLSACGEGATSDYPWVALRGLDDAPPRITPIAAVAAGSPRTPLTAIRPARSHEGSLRITAAQLGGLRTLELSVGALPVTVGRSRNQTLMVDRRHETVSGHHLDITELDRSGVQVVVHGDNGVTIDGVVHPAGARLHWNIGETMVLGEPTDEHPSCTMTLTLGGEGPA